MPYMLAPGARLMVGPGGRLEESLGACCSGCGPAALAGPGAAFLQQIAKPDTPLQQLATQSLATGKPMPIFYTPPPADPMMSASPGFGGSKTMLVVGVAAAIGVAVYALYGGRKRR